MKSIADPLQSVRASMEKARSRSGSGQPVELLAVSKGQPVEAIRSAYQAGQRHFGENYVQEALAKMEALADCPDICWHYIGPMQSNKTRAVAEHFDWMQTLDREKIAHRLSEQRPAGRAPLNVCVQVNISREPQKAGVLPEGLHDLMAQVMALPNLRIRGIMAIPAAEVDPEKQQAGFAALKALFDQARSRFPQLDTLSMGMSADFEQAIAEGSTLVRVGTRLFGQRQPRKEPPV